MNLKSIALILSVAGLAFAQGHRGPQPSNPSNPPRTGYGLDMTKAQFIEGAVSAVNISYGSQYPTIQVNQTTIKIAPVWFLIENDFEIKTGDKLRVTAAPSLQNRDPYLAAITLVNTATGATLRLRDTNGLPLWTQMPAAGQSTCNGCTGITQIGTAAGTVDQVTAGVGIQMPALVLKTVDGKVLTIKIGPERVLQTADFEIKAGDSLTVRYGVDRIGEMLALELVNVDGVKLVLRNDDGTPAWK